jgi:hypothetical protein
MTVFRLDDDRVSSTDELDLALLEEDLSLTDELDCSWSPGIATKLSSSPQAVKFIAKTANSANRQ